MAAAMVPAIAWSQGVAYVLEVSGPAEVRDEEGGEFRSLAAGTMLGAEAFVKTGKGSSVGLVYKDNTTQKLGPEVGYEVGSKSMSAIQPDKKLWGSLSKPAATRGDDLFGGPNLNILMPKDTRVLKGDLTLRWECAYVDPKFEVTVTQNSSGKVIFQEQTELRRIVVPLAKRAFERESRYTWTVRDPSFADDPGVSGTFYVISEDDEKSIESKVHDIVRESGDEPLGLVAAALHLQQAGYAAEADAKLSEAIGSVDEDVAFRRLQTSLYENQ